jgi:hypothetical protein
MRPAPQGQDRPARCPSPGRGLPARRLPPRPPAPIPSATRAGCWSGTPWSGRARAISAHPGLARQHGFHVPSGSAESFVHRAWACPCRPLALGGAAARPPAPSQPAAHVSDATIGISPSRIPVPRLRSVPCVGPVTAAASRRHRRRRTLPPRINPKPIRPRAPRVQLGRDAPGPHYGPATRAPAGSDSGRGSHPAPVPVAREELRPGPRARRAPCKQVAVAPRPSPAGPLCAAARWQRVRATARSSSRPAPAARGHVTASTTSERCRP